MAALTLRPTLTEVSRVLTPCHGATLHCVPSCTIQGTCRSLLMAGTLRVRTAEKTTLRRLRSLNVTRPESPASTAGLAHGRYTCYRYVSPPHLTPSLARCSAIATQVGLPIHTDTRASCVSVGYRHGSPHLLRWTSSWATACHPSTRATLIAHSKPLTLMYLRFRYAMSPMLRGGSYHYDGSNGRGLNNADG